MKKMNEGLYWRIAGLVLPFIILIYLQTAFYHRLTLSDKRLSEDVSVLSQQIQALKGESETQAKPIVLECSECSNAEFWHDMWSTAQDRVRKWEDCWSEPTCWACLGQTGGDVEFCWKMTQ